MKLQSFIFILLSIPSLSVAQGILALDWIENNNTLIATTSEKIITISKNKYHYFNGPNKSINDISLFQNDTKLLIATDKGAFISDLNFTQWKTFNDGLESQSVEFAFTNVALQNVLYLASQDNVYKYTPEDKSWINMDGGPGGNVTDYLHSDMPESMDTGWIFSSTDKGIVFTADCFCFWRDVRNFTHNVAAIAYQPEEPSWYYAATDSGLMMTKDGARSWEKLSNLPVNNTSAIVAADLNTLYIGTDSGDIWKLNISESHWEIVKNDD